MSFEQGYIKDWRSKLGWEWFTDVYTAHFFEYCLLSANHKDKKVKGEIIKKGSFVSSYERMSAATGLTVQQIRTAIRHLESTGEISKKSTNKQQTITVENWAFYQSCDDASNKQLTNEQQTINNKQECKEYKESNYIDTNNSIDTLNNSYIVSVQGGCPKPTQDQLKRYAKANNLDVDTDKFYAYYNANGWMFAGKKMKSWEDALRYWAIKDKGEVF